LSIQKEHNLENTQTSGLLTFRTVRGDRLTKRVGVGNCIRGKDLGNYLKRDSSV
jgi:hypothetical protein